jgi:Zn ribbon nucleic-acid-binding protein
VNKNWKLVITCKKCGRYLAGLACPDCTSETKAVLVVGAHCPVCKFDTVEEIQLNGAKKIENNS